jgi:protein phosphatase
MAADLTRGENSSSPQWAGRITLGARGALLAIADGRGEEADIASSLVVSSLAEALASEYTSCSRHERLTGALEDAHRLPWAQTCRQGIDMGATVAAVYIRGRAASIIEVGASRAYLVRGKEIDRLTRFGRASPPPDELLPFRNMALQAVGSSENALCTSACELRDDDHLLLCSDGVCREVPELEMRDVVLGEPSRLVAAARLVRMASRHGRPDDATVLVAKVCFMWEQTADIARLPGRTSTVFPEGHRT